MQDPMHHLNNDLVCTKCGADVMKPGPVPKCNYPRPMTFHEVEMRQELTYPLIERMRKQIIDMFTIPSHLLKGHP